MTKKCGYLQIPDSYALLFAIMPNLLDKHFIITYTNCIFIAIFQVGILII